MKIKNQSKLFLLPVTLLGIGFAFNSHAYYARDNFQQMEEFVHQRDLIRNLKQTPYKPQFNIPEEQALFINELRTPGSGYGHCSSKKHCKNGNSQLTNTYLNDYSSSYNYNYSSYWPF